MLKIQWGIQKNYWNEAQIDMNEKRRYEYHFQTATELKNQQQTNIEMPLIFNFI